MNVYIDFRIWKLCKYHQLLLRKAVGYLEFNCKCRLVNTTTSSAQADNVLPIFFDCCWSPFSCIAGIGI